MTDHYIADCRFIVSGCVVDVTVFFGESYQFLRGNPHLVGFEVGLGHGSVVGQTHAVVEARLDYDGQRLRETFEGREQNFEKFGVDADSPFGARLVLISITRKVILDGVNPSQKQNRKTVINSLQFINPFIRGLFIKSDGSIERSPHVIVLSQSGHSDPVRVRVALNGINGPIGAFALRLAHHHLTFSLDCDCGVACGTSHAPSYHRVDAVVSSYVELVATSDLFDRDVDVDCFSFFGLDSHVVAQELHVEIVVIFRDPFL